MSRHDDVREAVRDSFSFWLSQHPVSVPEIIQLAVKEAVAEYLDKNGLPSTEGIKGPAIGEDGMTLVRSHLRNRRSKE